MYWLFVLLSFVDAKVFIPIQSPVKNSLLSVIAMLISLMIGLAFYLGLGILFMGAFRLNQYYSRRGERIESILTLMVIGLAFVLISYIKPTIV